MYLALEWIAAHENLVLVGRLAPSLPIPSRPTVRANRDAPTDHHP
jgi:hypothetical protein